VGKPPDCGDGQAAGKNKCKEIQINPRKKAWIHLDLFGGFEDFQWVTPNPNKKISGPRLCMKRPTAVSPLSPDRPRSAGLVPVD
jgi:hypothetical protein